MRNPIWSSDDTSQPSRRRVLQTAVGVGVGLASVSSASTATAQSDDSPTGDVTITIDNVGNSAWSVDNIDGTGAEAADGDNPEVTLTRDQRYVIENNGWSAHPLAFRDADGDPLLSQDATGQYEDDAAVDWVDNDTEVAFTLTEPLAEDLAAYNCTVHAAMEGDIDTVDELTDEHESGVSQELFDAVDQDDSGELSRDEVRDMINDYATEGEVDGVAITRGDVRDLINFYAQQ